VALTNRFADALTYASQLHAVQVRKGTKIPYVTHLLSVAAVVLEHGATEDEAIAALLHDAIEDQGGAPTREEIRRRFGDAVVSIVDGCTDAEVIPKPPWRQRKEHHIAELQHASASVLLVSAADILHNARAILADYRQQGEALWSRFRAGKEEQLWYYRSFLKALRDNPASNRSLNDELGQVVAELESLAKSKR
jgi:GTP pyrophosphokinase